MNLAIRATAIALATLILAGCATQQIDWKTRVGNYTYDQAVMDYGPPDKTAKLSDDSTVAEWMMQRGQVVETPEPGFYPPGYWGPAWYGFSSTYMPGKYLLLTFGPDGKLKAWRHHYK
ncbi:MAG TPA: hypothetical protein VFV23_15005 [Verrucomicrobiae bacterium]|nr:hypothetical protein [Verrucomicrobiae bacterium]